jgi:hypothetical protein
MKTRTIKLITPNGSTDILEWSEKTFYVEVSDNEGVQFLFEILPDGTVFRTDNEKDGRKRKLE